MNESVSDTLRKKAPTNDEGYYTDIGKIMVDAADIIERRERTTSKMLPRIKREHVQVCPIHGEVDTMTLRFKTNNCAYFTVKSYCVICYMEFLEQHVHTTELKVLG